jgi:hypothetical protein
LSPSKFSAIIWERRRTWLYARALRFRLGGIEQIQGR